ncbi:MAG: hypothetical protein ABUT39_19720 [Acidobacteriota bacterium]
MASAPRRRFLLFLLLTAVSVSPAMAAPVLTFEPQAVAASGITPKGRVVWFSIAREISRRAATIVPRIELAADEDGDGQVRFDLGRDVPLRSIWFAVDLETGEAGVAAPEDFGLQEAELPARAIPAALNGLDLDRRFIYALLVRPGAGAWVLRAGDGSALDEDGAPDGTLRARLASFTGLGPSPLPSPTHVSARDLLLVIDPNRMEFLRLRVGH